MITPHRASRTLLVASLISPFLLRPPVAEAQAAPLPIPSTNHSGLDEREAELAIPEVYELVNIAIALTLFGETHPYYVDSDSPYHAEILERFGAHKNHPFITRIQELHGDVDESNFLKHRATACRFVDDEIDCNREGLFFPTEENEAQFDEELILAAQFARDTGFRSFFEEHLPFYQQRMEMFGAAVPVDDAWEWLEEQFPARNQRIRIFLSPLTGWSHFAVGRRDYTEIFIFGPPEFVESTTEAAWFTMVLFTELDHKYVDIASQEHADEIVEAFSDIEAWNGQAGYGTPQLTFSEYMTWAVFCLFASDTYSPAEFSEIKEQTEEFMTVNRGFPRFVEFNDQVLSMYRNRKEGETVPDLYQGILDWAQEAGGAQPPTLPPTPHLPHFNPRKLPRR